MQVLGAVLRFVVAAVVLMLLGYIVPGFSHLSFGQALIAAIVVALLSWLVQGLFGRAWSTTGRGISSFLVSALVLYVAQYVVPGMRVSILGALIAALLIGLVDAFVPTGIGSLR